MNKMELAVDLILAPIPRSLWRLLYFPYHKELVLIKYTIQGTI